MNEYLINFPKKLYSILICTFIVGVNLNAQIEILSEDLPSLGTKALVGNASDPDIDVGIASSSEAQIWNFKSIEIESITEVEFIDTTGTGGGEEFPNALMSRLGTFGDLIGIPLDNVSPLFSALPSGTGYYSIDNAGNVVLEGMYIPLTFADSIDLGENALPADPPLPIWRVGKLGDSYSDDAEVSQLIPFDTLTIQLATEVDNTTIVDAYGELQFCDISHEVLRYKEFNDITLNVAAGFEVFGNFVPIFTLVDTTFQLETFRFYAKGLEYPVASVVTVPDGPVLSADVILQDADPKLCFSYEDSCGTVEFYSHTMGELTNHAWNFGDGASTQGKNALHTYLSTGTYTVVHSAEDSDGNIIEASEILEIDCIDTAIEIPEWGRDITIFPNPVQEAINLKMNSEILKKSKDFRLYDSQMKVVEVGKLNNLNRLNVSSLSAGVYILIIEGEDDQKVFKKIIKAN